MMDTLRYNDRFTFSITAILRGAGGQVGRLSPTHKLKFSDCRELLYFRSQILVSLIYLKGRTLCFPRLRAPLHLWLQNHYKVSGRQKYGGDVLFTIPREYSSIFLSLINFDYISSNERQIQRQSSGHLGHGSDHVLLRIWKGKK
jgi:hypothetical protein